jgi:flavoprotein
MKFNIFAQVMAFVLTWALFVMALPSSEFLIQARLQHCTDCIDAGGVPGISVRQETAGALLGINCRGSSQCNGVCHPNIGNIKYFADQIRESSTAVCLKLTDHSAHLQLTTPNS